MKSNWRSQWILSLLLGVGFLQVLGFITQIELIRDLGRMTAASPLPLVFSDFRGLETFSLEFRIKAETTSGERVEKILEPAIYGKFEGAYNRRNIYGAVLAYGPKLSKLSEKALVDSVLRFGFCGEGPLTKMFETSEPFKTVTIITTSKAKGSGEPFVTEVKCL